MKLHSINQENKTAIIDTPGTLVAIEYYDRRETGETVWLTNESCAMVENEGLSVRRVRALIWSYITGLDDQEEVAQPNPEEAQYSAYEIDVSDLSKIDIYEICDRFKMLDYSGRRHHALKKIILAGTRTGKKPAYKDIKEARDTLTKWLNANG